MQEAATIQPRAATAARRQGTQYLKCREACLHYTGQFTDITTIGALEIQRFRAAGVPLQLIDVRLPEEQAVSMIEGAVSQDEFEASELKGQQPAAGTILVPYCTIGYRSGLYAQRLKAKGYTDVRNGEGIIMWTQDIGSGLVDASGNDVKRVHTYGALWDFCSADYESVQFGAWNWLTSHASGVLRWLSSFWLTPQPPPSTATIARTTSAAAIALMAAAAATAEADAQAATAEGSTDANVSHEEDHQ